MAFDVVAYLLAKGYRGRPASGGREITYACFMGCEEPPDSRKRKLYINVEDGVYKCFVCNSSGGSYLLQKHFGDTPRQDSSDEPFVRRQILDWAADLGAEMLGNREDVLLYLLDERGLGPETIVERKLGFVGDNWSLTGSLPADFTRGQLATTGLVHRDGPRAGRDFFTQHILIPIQHRGHTLAIRGRAWGETRGGKYMSGPGEVVRAYNLDSLDGAEEVILTEGEFDCFSNDTEVLTPQGWVNFDDYEPGTPVVQYEDGGALRLVPPMAFTTKWAERTLRLHTHKRGGIDLRVTPEHRMVATFADGTGLRIHPAADRPSTRYHIPRVGVLEGPGIEYSDDEIRLLLAIAADATIDLRVADGAQYVRFGFRKTRKAERLVEILGALGIEHSARILECGNHSICFRVPAYLRAFKRLPRDWIVQASAAQRELILAEMVIWDGNKVVSRSQDEFNTSSSEDATWMQAIAHTSGRVSTLQPRKNAYGEWFKASILHDKRSTSWQSIKVEEAGPAQVSCVQVPSGMLLVRRNGEVAVSGNCMVLAQHLAASGEDRAKRIAVVGLPGTNAVPDDLDSYLADVKRIFIGFDADEPGKLGAEKLRDRYGQRARVLELPNQDGKAADWSDFLLPGKDDTVWRLAHPFAGHGASDVLQLMSAASGKRIFSMAESGASFRSTRQVAGGLKTGYRQLDAVIEPGLLPGQVVFVLAKTGVGKGSPHSTLVPTPEGFRKWGDLVVGDEVFGSDGRPTIVTGIYDRGTLPTYEVRFSDGASLRVDGDHLWSVSQRAGHRREWHGSVLSTAELIAQGLRKGPEFRWVIPMTQPVQYPEADLPVEPYTLGALLANGYMEGTSAYLTTPGDGVIERIRRHYEVNQHPRYGCSRYAMQGLIGALRQLGVCQLSSDKFIPDQYLRVSVPQRIALLQGLMDGAGLSRAKQWRGSVLYFTSSRRLASDICELVNSLGGTVTEQWTVCGDRPEGKVNIVLPKGISAFSIPRKDLPVEATYGREPRRAIVAIEPVGDEEIRCISVAASDQLYLVGREYLVTHNTLVLCNLAFNMRGKRILFVSLEMTREEVYHRLERIYYFHNPLATVAELEYALSTIWICDENRLGEKDIQALVSEYEIENGARPDVVMIDYLGYYARGFKGNSPYEKTTSAAMQQKADAKAGRLVIISPAQVNRGGQDGKPLDLDDARDSVTGDTRVVLADGSYVPIADLVDTHPELLVVDKRYRWQRRRAARVWAKGEREVYTVTTRTGRRFTATPEHPMLTDDREWCPVTGLRVGDRIAIPGELPVFGTEIEPHAELLGMLTADPKSPERVTPAHIFRTTRESIAAYLRGLYSCDGHVTMTGVYYSSASERLMRDVQHLLTRFAVTSTLGDEGGIWRLSIRRREDIARFREHIGVVGERGDKLDRLLQRPNLRPADCRLDLFSPALYEELQQARRSAGLEWGALSPRRTSLVRGHAFTRRRLQWLAQQVRAGRLQDLAESPLIFDEITSIEPAGRQVVYDASVVGLHNFTGDFVFSNSGAIEETGDFVLSVYRPENALSPGQTAENVRPSGTLRVSVLKSRHGGVGRTFSLAMDLITLAIVDAESPKAKLVEDDNYKAWRGTTWQDLRAQQTAPRQLAMGGGC